MDDYDSDTDDDYDDYDRGSTSGNVAKFVLAVLVLYVLYNRINVKDEQTNWLLKKVQDWKKSWQKTYYTGGKPYQIKKRIANVLFFGESNPPDPKTDDNFSTWVKGLPDKGNFVKHWKDYQRYAEDIASKINSPNFPTPQVVSSE